MLAACRSRELLLAVGGSSEQPLRNSAATNFFTVDVLQVPFLRSYILFSKPLRHLSAASVTANGPGGLIDQQASSHQHRMCRCGTLKLVS